jgi:dTDP-4-dehydrorhamnose 3,5-epimerase
VPAPRLGGARVWYGSRMEFVALPLAGAFAINLEPVGDDRGWFARTWCEREFADHGLSTRFVQANVSFNRRTGTLRGLHWQEAPHAEAKLVRVTAGAIWDVMVDLRPGSPTYLRHAGLRLDTGSGRMAYVPEGFAHGFITLSDDTEVAYQMSEFYAPGAARGARWDDPAFGIEWPLEPAMISPKDRTWPPFRP